MYLIRLSLVFFLVLLSSVVLSQNGFIRGVIIDDVTGESVPGVSIIIDGTTKGTATDLDGKFNLSIEPGKYTVKVSFVSFETLIIKDIEVKEKEVTFFNNIRLKEAVNELNQVTITADMARNNENTLLTMKKKSPNLIDGISSDNFKKIGDSDAGSSVKRVPGVSVTGGKYVYVRGLGDRYTKTILNGVDIPGLDPDRNTLQMDIFPTNIIDNIIVHKSFVAELPADFTGGVVDIAIKDFPDRKKGSFSASTSYNPNFHLNKNYLTYEGGKTDFLGFDDGTREIPAISNVPFFTEVVGNPIGEKAQRYKEILGSFNPTMSAMKQTSLLDLSLGADFGNQVVKKKTTLGYNFVLSYKNETEFYKNAEYGRYGLSGDAIVTEMQVRELQTGEYGVNNVLLSGLAGFAIKTQKSKFGINLIHLQNGESKAGIFDYENSDQGAVFYGYQHNLEYSQRSLSNMLISGKHGISSDKWEIEWKLSPTYSQIDDPDIRFTRYEKRDNNFFIGTEAGFPQRIWRELNELNLAGILNTTKEFKFRDEPAKLKIGGAYIYKNRDFILRSYNLNIRNVPLTGNPNELFDPANLWPFNGNISQGTTYEATFLPVNANQYNSNISNIAGYVAAELNPLKLVKTIIGVRIENYTQRYTGQDQLGYNKLNDQKVLDDLNLFPTLNVVYAYNEKNNLRMSYARTIARPSFKELSYAEIYDPITGRTFIGGLFRDENNIEGEITAYWDGKLVSSDIYNYDFRWEFFPALGQTVSAGIFYKKFLNPIEMVQFATQAGAFQPRNVGNGEILGGEIELRQSLKILSQSLKNFSLAFNFTITESRIELSPTEYESRVANARQNQQIKEYRDMAGQAPFLINGGISYSGGEKGIWKSFEAGLYYNVQGRTLQYVGIADRPDIYANPFHSLNFNANKKFGKSERMQCGVKVENILNDKTESVFRSFNSADQYFTRLEPGVRVQLRVAYNMF